MQNVYFEVFFKPIVDKDKRVRYRKLKVVKVRGKERETLTLGRLLNFVNHQFDRLQILLKEEERLMVELPLDFLVSKSLIEGLPLEKFNFLLGDPVSKIGRKKLISIKQYLEEYLKNGLEISFLSNVYLNYKYNFPPKYVAFVCIPPEEGLTFHKNCFFNVDTLEIFEKLKEKGEYFCGRLFGDFEKVLEINALSYLQTTISKALEILGDENADISALEKIIKTDPQLVVGLLKYVNSPLIAPPSPIKDIRHAIIYLGLERLKEFLLMVMLNNLASVDTEFKEIALRLGAVGLLIEQKGKEKKLPFSGCQLFLGGLVLAASKIFGKPIEEILNMLSIPQHCNLPLEDKRFLELFNDISDVEIEKAIFELRKLFEGEN